MGCTLLLSCVGQILDRSFFIAGHQLSKISKNELIAELYEGRAQYKGKMSKEDMAMLLDAAMQSPLFSVKDKKYFCQRPL